MSFRKKALAGTLAVSIGVSGYMFSARSHYNLQEVDKDLQRVATCALDKSLVDFVVVDGRRTAEEQLVNIANGKSWIKRSRHQDGKAIDIAALENGKVTYGPEPYYKISDAFYYCSDKLNIPIVWGGEWRVQDLMHIELEKGAYP